MIANEDRVSRTVIDECARRGEAMLPFLRGIAEGESAPETPGAWWLRLHTAKILGLLPSEAAGLLLIRLMQHLADKDEEDLQDWLACDWPWLFANKPERVLVELRGVCADRSRDWYERANALGAVVAYEERRGSQALEEALDWVARRAADGSEDWDTRLSCGNLLLDFPRPRFRSLLDDLARRQPRDGAMFLADDVEDAFAASCDQPEWREREDPWAFYYPEAIALRQERWAREEAEGDDDFDELDDLSTSEGDPTFVRPAPKIGRNEPCPCGSGKKYKKCCLGRLAK